MANFTLTIYDLVEPHLNRHGIDIRADFHTCPLLRSRCWWSWRGSPATSSRRMRTARWAAPSSKKCSANQEY